MIVMLFLPLLEEKFLNVNNLTLNLKAQTNLEFIKSFKAMNLTAIFSRNSKREIGVWKSTKILISHEFESSKLDAFSTIDLDLVNSTIGMLISFIIISGVKQSWFLQTE